MKSTNIALLFCLVALGCSRLPAVTEVEGTVYLNDEPLPNARIQFIPELDGFGAEVYSQAITDEQGHYCLSFPFKEKTGAVVGKHRVVIADPPPPKEMRGQREESQEKVVNYFKGLKNRPIPRVYASAVNTPLVVEVKGDQQIYDLHLSPN
jgi:hypothetical protein